MSTVKKCDFCGKIEDFRDKFQLVSITPFNRKDNTYLCRDTKECCGTQCAIKFLQGGKL